MEVQTKSKEVIALELALSAYEGERPSNADKSPEGKGKAIAALYNAIYENLNIEY